MPHQRLHFVAFVAFSACELTDLNAADDGGGEGRIVLCAQHDGVHQNKATEQRESGEVRHRFPRRHKEAVNCRAGLFYPMTQESTNCIRNIRSDQPLNADACQPTNSGKVVSVQLFERTTCGRVLKTAHRLQVSGVVGVRRGGQDHDQSVVVEEPVLAQLLHEQHRHVWVCFFFFFGETADSCHTAHVALLTLESSFCFMYAPLAAVRTLFSIMKTYPSRSNAKSSLQSAKIENDPL